MTKSIRLTTVLTLLVTFLVAGLLPAAGSWSCPDGTACVYTRGRGFHCLDQPCRMTCCAVRRRHDCCGHCEAGPGAIAAAARPVTAGAPAHCRYHQRRHIGPVLASPRLTLHRVVSAVNLPPAPFEMPVVLCILWLFAPTRGSPPTAHLPPSSSPRAPPQPDHA